VALLILLRPVSLVALVADKAGVVDSGELVRSFYELMVGQARDRTTALGPAPEEAKRAEAALDEAKRIYARARGGANPEAMAAAREVVQEKAAALQALYGETTQDLKEVFKWRSRDVAFEELRSRIEEFGREQGFDILVERQTGKPMFRREGFSGSPSDPPDVTAELIEWIRRKEDAARSSHGTPP